MNKVNFPLKSLILIAALNNSSSFAQNYQSKLGCVGVDFLYSTMKMDERFGGNIFAKSAPGVNLSFGKQFHEYFGFEVGYEVIKRKVKDTTITDPNTLIYGSMVEDPPEFYKSTIKKTKPYVGLTSTLSISNQGFAQLLIGAALVKIKSYSILLRDNNGPANEVITSNKSKLIPTLKFIMGGNVFNDLGLKASLSWDNTKKIRRTRGGFALELKNTVNFGVGLMYQL